MNELAFRVPRDHAAFAGHFPGAPILPGVLLLDETLRRIAGELGREWLTCRVDMAKFHHVVHPGDELCVEFELLANRSVRFAVVRGGVAVATGKLLPPDGRGTGGAERA